MISSIMVTSMDISVENIKGVGGAKAKLLKKVGIETVLDLVTYYPRTYNDYSTISVIVKLMPGTVCIKAKLTSIAGRYVRRGMHITEAIATDDSGSVKLVWFNQPYRATSMKRGEQYFFVGEYGLHGKNLSISSPESELISDMPINAARIVPIYRETKGLTSRLLRSLISQGLDCIDSLEIVPSTIQKEELLLPWKQAVKLMHFPNTMEDIEQARSRLAFEELFVLQVASLLNKNELKGQHSLSIAFDEKLAKKFVENLPFKLTDAQRRVVWQIYKDIEKDEPMNRILEGDVGSGKTVVALMAALMCIASGHQVVLMAPTEILARQHAETIYRLLEPIGMHVSVGLLIGAVAKNKKQILKEMIASGRTKLIIGTHALIQDDVTFSSLGLIIVDEQHRFGVEQRRTLQKKAGHMPHVLHMTATPIPRSLALTVYGELDVSILDAKPAGRAPITTTIVSPNSLQPMHLAIKKEIEKGRQCFWVCPLITESAVLAAKSAEKVALELKQSVFKSMRIGLLHGKMKSAEKEKIMHDFLDHKLDILVSTTVIEVGVDVPNASVMVIQNADRFGLSQLHQLRGRVGRGNQAGMCYLALSDSKAVSKRLRYLEQSNDGFKLAEYDLQLRGPGAIYGSSQHGALDLRVANLTDVVLISRARSSAKAFLDGNPDLSEYAHLNVAVLKARSVTNLN